MFEAIDTAAENLHSRQAGWVTRRDGADLLGKVASRALAALHQSKDEMDVDVRRAVDAALGQASAALAGVKPALQESSVSLDDLARSIEKPGERTVEKNSGDEYTVTVKLKSGRTQAVRMRAFKRPDGMNVVQVSTVCGKVDEKALAWALRANMTLVQGAVALAKEDGEERFLVIRTFLADHVTRQEMKATVKECAYYGDWMENKLTGKDAF
ncbi:MAG: hypothetical protein IT364_15720 [Candidatus Hydrogenedentes bacterium]|nr:hypothetical protein [Candidatus Hydrogenedentota bacterium]